MCFDIILLFIICSSANIFTSCGSVYCSGLKMPLDNIKTYEGSLSYVDEWKVWIVETPVPSLSFDVHGNLWLMQLNLDNVPLKWYIATINSNSFSYWINVVSMLRVSWVFVCMCVCPCACRKKARSTSAADAASVSQCQLGRCSRTSPLTYSARRFIAQVRTYLVISPDRWELTTVPWFIDVKWPVQGWVVGFWHWRIGWSKMIDFPSVRNLCLCACEEVSCDEWMYR